MTAADRLKFARSGEVTDRETGADLGRVWRDEHTPTWHGARPDGTEVVASAGSRLDAGLALFTRWRSDVDADAEALAAQRAEFAELVAAGQGDDDPIDVEILDGPIEVEATTAEIVPIRPAAGIVPATVPIQSTSTVFATWLEDLNSKTVKAYLSDLANLARFAASEGAPIDLTSPREDFYRQAHQPGAGAMVHLFGGGRPDLLPTMRPLARVEALGWLFGLGQIEAHAAARRWLATMDAPSTRARRRACLQSFAALAGEIGALTYPFKLKARSKADKVTRGAGARRKAPADNLVRQLLARSANPSTVTEHRDRAVIALLVWGGLRRFEICGIDVENVDLAAGSLMVHRKHGAEGDLEEVELTPATVVALQGHIRNLGRTSGPVFVSSSGPTAGQRLQPDAIGHLLTRACRALDAPHITPHTLRHYGATKMAANGADAAVIQAHLGHATQEAAASYVETEGQRARRRTASGLIDDLVPDVTEADLGEDGELLDEGAA